jgi:hypothetical protein
MQQIDNSQYGHPAGDWSSIAFRHSAAYSSYIGRRAESYRFRLEIEIGDWRHIKIRVAVRKLMRQIPFSSKVPTPGHSREFQLTKAPRQTIISAYLPGSRGTAGNQAKLTYSSQRGSALAALAAARRQPPGGHPQGDKND